MDEIDRESGVLHRAPADESGSARNRAVICPFCASHDVERIALFGGQLSTDQYYCRACRSYFERFARDEEEQ